MRIVLDTSVLIEAYLGQGLSNQILQRCIDGEIELVASFAILEELEDKLKEKFHRPAGVVAEYAYIIKSAGVYLEKCESVEAPKSFAGDEHLLDAAVAGDALIIVTLDKKLLRVKSVHNIAILHPRSVLYVLVGIDKRK